MRRDELLAQMQADTEDSEAVAPGDVVELGEHLLHLKDKLADAKEEVKEIQGEYDEVRNRQLPEAMAAAGLVNDSGQGKFTLSDGSTVYLRSTVYANLLAADRGRFHDWCRSQGHGDLIKETIHGQTFKAWVKEQLEGGGKIPEYITQYPETSAALRKGRAK